MANSELYGKTFPVPSEVLKTIQTTLVSNPSGEGVRRAKFILKNGTLTYQDMKRLKNYFDHFSEGGDNVQYALAGGNLMKTFIDQKLGLERAVVKDSKKIRQDMNVDPNLATHAYQTPRLNEEKKDKKEEKQKNALAVIVNEDNKILLLKRAKIKDIWMPEKWALVGGMIEKGETPQKAVEREITEETGLKIDKFIKTFAIQRNPGSIEHIFACRYNGDPTEIILNNENTNYGWYDVDEMNYLDIVPHLIEYITLSFKKYE
jgi:8-oxo-dGTP diphosphatase